MLHWKIALAAGLPAATFLIVFCFVIYRRFCCNRVSKHEHLRHSQGNPYKLRNQGRLFSGLHLSRRDPLDSALRYSSRVANVWRMTYPIKLFDWTDHPTLVAEAVEHGWGAFAFTYTCSTCPVPVNFWDMCTSCSHKHDYEPEITWELGGGSEYMQKLRLNPGMLPKKENSLALVQALQTALPLPGPPLGAHSFAQEAYFEVTILAEGREYNVDASQSSLAENEHVKLISKHLLSGKQLDSELTSNYPNEMFEESGEPQNPPRQDLDHLQVIGIGLAAGGAPPFRLPGCDVGSVGFHSNGRVYLNGVHHMDSKFPAMKHSWGVIKTTVGCGFDPISKKLFFTVDGEHVYELTTVSNEFGNPLYPTVASNYDVTLLVNFGQTPFEYALANAYRVADPCFRRLYSRSSKNGFANEDSGDLFSMGRIDSQWFTGIPSPGSEDVQHRHVLSEAESDLFEIVLDSRS